MVWVNRMAEEEPKITSAALEEPVAEEPAADKAEPIVDKTEEWASRLEGLIAQTKAIHAAFGGLMHGGIEPAEIPGRLREWELLHEEFDRIVAEIRGK